MKLIDDWRAVLHKAWSSRIAFLGAAFAAGGMALPAFIDEVSPLWFLGLCMLCCLGVVFARVVDQPKMRGDDDA